MEDRKPDRNHLLQLERGIHEYSCLFHPKDVGTSLDSKCSQCERAFGFALEDAYLPNVINGKQVEKGLGRGFFGVVYKTTHPNLASKKYAVKLVPTATYAPNSHGGYEKELSAEVALLEELRQSGVTPTINDTGVTIVQIDGVEMQCHFIEMDFVEGMTLAQVIAHGPIPNPKTIYQIALDLLEVVAQLAQHSKVHNDLHGANIIVSTLPDHAARGGSAIHPLTKVTVLDLGAGADVPRADTRLTDVQWVAHHILSLVGLYEDRTEQVRIEDRRLCAQLRRVAEHFFGDPDPVNPPNPRDVQSLVYDAWTQGRRPYMQPARLPSMSTHINARTMPAWFAPELLHDPDGKWGRAISAPGTHLIYGMRGCGKTMLLRSLEWSARLHARSLAPQTVESVSDVVNRVDNEAFLGLFVSCNALLSGQRPEVVRFPLQRTFLAFAGEVMLNAELCQVNEMGQVDGACLKKFMSAVQRHIPWMSVPAGYVTPGSVGEAIDSAMRYSPDDDHSDFTVQDAFEDLAGAAIRLVDIWHNKHVLFMLDDLSKRILRPGSVDLILSNLSVSSSAFSFKVSTESQTLVPQTSGGYEGQLGREYISFNLGEEVYSELGGVRGVAFIDELLSRRLKVLDNPTAKLPRTLIGSGRSLKQLAQDIQSGERDVYHGLESLAAMCVGDISDIIQLYQKLEMRAEEVSSRPLPKRSQHAEAINLATSKLRTIQLSSDWLHSHALAFANAAHRELKNSSPDRPRLYGNLHISIPLEGGSELYPRIVELVEAGIYVFAGGNDRSKSPNDPHTLQIKLAFRNILGLPSQIPLGRRDRFELRTMDTLSEWLENPSADALTGLPEEDGAPLLEFEVEADPQFPDAEVGQLAIPFDSPSVNTMRLPPIRGNFSVRSTTYSALSEMPFEWSSATIIGGVGFEDRGVASWNRLANAGAATVVALRYPNVGRADEVDEIFSNAGIDAHNLNLHDVVNNLSRLDGLLEPTSPLVIDITSLTKVAIFRLVRTFLKSRREVHLVYTEAASYFPPESELQRIERELTASDPEQIRALDQKFGNSAFRTVVVEDSRDPLAGSLLCAPIPLKHSRVGNLLSELNFDRIAAIVPVSSRGPSNARNDLTHVIADYFVDLIGGDKYPIAALDHEGLYRTMDSIHAEAALTFGLNFEVVLSGSKLHTVSAAMLAATTTLAGVYFSEPVEGFDERRFTEGYGQTTGYTLRRVRSEDLTTR